MTLEQRRDIALKLLANAGCGRWQSAPALWRWCWRMGFDVPPPPFMDEVLTIAACVAAFALIWGPLRLIEALSSGGFALMPLLAWLGFGLLAGAAFAALNAHRRHKLGLPAWRDLHNALVLA